MIGGRKAKGKLTRRLNLATIHSKHNPGTPIQETLGDTFADETDRLTSETAHIDLVF